MKNNDHLEAFKKVAEEFEKENFQEKEGLQSGNLAIIGASAPDLLEDFFSKLIKDDVHFVNEFSITDEIIQNLKSQGISTFIVPNISAFSMDESALRRLAKRHEIKVIAGTHLIRRSHQRLSQDSDYPSFRVRDEAGILIGITEKGICVNKNRYSGRILGEVTLEKALELL